MTFFSMKAKFTARSTMNTVWFYLEILSSESFYFIQSSTSNDQSKVWKIYSDVIIFIGHSFYTTCLVWSLVWLCWWRYRLYSDIHRMFQLSMMRIFQWMLLWVFIGTDHATYVYDTHIRSSSLIHNCHFWYITTHDRVKYFVRSIETELKQIADFNNIVTINHQLCRWVHVKSINHHINNMHISRYVHLTSTTTQKSAPIIRSFYLLLSYTSSIDIFVSKMMFLKYCILCQYLSSS